MIDGVMSGVLGGMLADPLGNYLSRFRYRTVFLGGFTATFIGLRFFYSVATLYTTLFEGKEGVIGRLFSLEILFVLLGLSLLGGIYGIFNKAFAVLLTWEEAEAVLLNSGYTRTINERGEVIFEKDKARLIAKNTETGIPQRIECWHKGERKLDVLLRPRPARKRGL